MQGTSQLFIHFFEPSVYGCRQLSREQQRSCDASEFIPFASMGLGGVFRVFFGPSPTSGLPGLPNVEKAKR